MNIFVTDLDPVLAAQNLCDKHCVRMITETAQLLCTSHWIGWSKHLNAPSDLRGKKLKLWLQPRIPLPELQPPYSLTHFNHPCAIWTRKCLGNYNWLVRHGMALCAEYTRRYGRIHKTEAVIRWAGSFLPPVFDATNPKDMHGLTPFALAMPEEYKVPGDPVQSYRNYYLGSKVRFAKWRHGPEPSWWKPGSL